MLNERWAGASEGGVRDMSLIHVWRCGRVEKAKSRRARGKRGGNKRLTGETKTEVWTTPETQYRDKDGKSRMESRHKHLQDSKT